jgi:hypothetical protein
MVGEKPRAGACEGDWAAESAPFRGTAETVDPSDGLFARRPSGRGRGTGTVLALSLEAFGLAWLVAFALWGLCFTLWAAFCGDWAPASSGGTSSVPERRRLATQAILLRFMRRLRPFAAAFARDGRIA